MWLINVSIYQTRVGGVDGTEKISWLMEELLKGPVGVHDGGGGAG